MTTVDFEPLSISIPLVEDPPGVFRIGSSRVLLELVLRAYQRGETPEGIVRSFRSLQLADVYAIITRYLTNPRAFDAYLRHCDQLAGAVARQVAASQPASVTRDELLARATAKGLVK